MENAPRRKVLYPMLLSLAVIVGIFLGAATSKKAVPVGDLPASLAALRNSPGKMYTDNKLVYALSLIDHLYVDPINMDSLTQSALIALLGELDPHSTYIPAESMAGANETLEGEFDGIGVVFNMSTDTVVVLNVIPGGPSDKAGVNGGDRIIKIGDSLVAGQKVLQTDIMKMLRGPRGTTVNLALQRQGIAELVPITVTRDKIDIKSLDAAFMIKPGIGFIKLTAFARNSLAEITQALARLREEGMKALVFDLRDNSGGYLEQAVIIANMFLPKGKMIVYTEDRMRRRVEEFSNGSGDYTDLPLVILVNEGSASASEILSGAVQDNDRGVIVGRRTFGKGLVQQQILFADHSAMRLTIARYYTPTGRSIQKPYSDGAEEYRMDLYNRFAHNEYFSADSIRFDDSLAFTTPGGRTVYGGGGIMPDVFVPLDTTGVSPYFIQVSGRNILYRYVLAYSDRHREAMNRVSTVAQLDSLLDADGDLLQDFVAYAAREGVRPDYAGIRTSGELITAQLRALIGRNTSLQDVGFYANIHPVDNMVMKAIGQAQALVDAGCGGRVPTDSLIIK